MGVRKEIDGSAGVAAFYGKELRHQREGAGLTLEQLAEGSFYGLAYVSEIEHGRRTMPTDLSTHVDLKLGTDGFFARNREDVRKARLSGQADYFAPIAQSEKRARLIEEWSTTLVPGLLQTEAYARAVIHSTHPHDLPEEVDQKVHERLKRAAIFDDPQRPEYWVILSETLLRDSPLPPAEMAEQLDRIVELARRRRIVVQILPHRSAPLGLTTMTMTFMEFDDEPPLLYTEGPYHGHTVDDPGLVGRYRRAYDRLRAAALPPEASLDMIASAAEDYRNGTHPH